MRGRLRRIDELRSSREPTTTIPSSGAADVPDADRADLEFAVIEFRDTADRVSEIDELLQAESRDIGLTVAAIAARSASA